MNIIVKDNGTEVASGTLVVDTSTNPPSATFTPDDGTETACTSVTWSGNDGATIRFNFKVSDQANGDFPLGPNGASHTYNFNGIQTANGLPSGNVNWPNAEAGITEDDNATWQAEATEDEPYARTQGAT
jgi:hypothetical protein